MNLGDAGGRLQYTHADTATTDNESAAFQRFDPGYIIDNGNMKYSVIGP